MTLFPCHLKYEITSALQFLPITRTQLFILYGIVTENYCIMEAKNLCTRKDNKYHKIINKFI
ncbi:hypothetical protein BpHYR1_050238 [Brachionus plicatilis]|uniref:Uncharacterized protein n=1 Tax=Brachionus plicatilis TaxID=10195 RepID=A0A3M7RJG4_BRAPC|nr:hypothetical protein BpHYR1_050238 [Brachionus plicatilis]